MADVVVVGAGIIGASVAYHAAKAGAEVALLDTSLPASGVTGSSFAWVGASGEGVDVRQELLRRSVLADHRRLEAELPGVQVRWTGSLRWGPHVPAEHGRLAAGERVVDADQVARLEPNLRTPPAWALHTPGDGAVDPVALTEALVRGAEGRGADLRVGVTVTALRTDRGRVVGVETSTGPIASPVVVLAAGTGAPPLCAPLGFALPVTPSPALLMRFSAPADLVRTVVVTPQLEVRQAADGDLLVTGGYGGEVSRDDLRRTGQVALRHLGSTFAGAEDLDLVGVRVGVRPMPTDGAPVVGEVPGARGAYLAVMHSGVTVAPTVGRLVAAEVVHGVLAEELRDLRPARFLVDAARCAGAQLDEWYGRTT